MRAFKIISSLDMSSGPECNKEMQAFNTIGTQQPLIAFAQSGDRVHRETRNRSQEISEVTKNSALFSGVSTLQRRVIKSKDSEEETITYHLNLHPDSMKYTFSSTTEPRKVSYYTEQQLLARPGTSGYARHSRMTELPQNNNYLRNGKSLQCRSRSNEVTVYEEKSTYCRPVVDLHTAEFVKRTIDKNNRLRCIVRDIIEARKEGKKQDAWNNFINDLKTKHGYNYYTYESVYVPKQYQLVSDNLRRYNLPSQCGTVRSWPNDNYNTTRNLESIKRPYPNDMLCYPISSAAHMKFKHRLNSLVPNYLTTDCIIQQNPRRRKRRHSLVQTSAYRVESRHNTFKTMKDESEGHETCLCFAAITMDEFTLTDSTNKVEHATTTNLEVIDKRSHGSECFCKKDKATFIHSEVALSEYEKKFRTCSTEVDTILKDLMKNEADSNINVSTKPSDGNKINSIIQEYENNLDEIDERSHGSGCFCKKDKTTAMQSEIALSENEKKIRTCSTEAEKVLKDFMNKNKECHINGSTKQSDVKKIICTSQQHQTNLEGIDKSSHGSGCFCKKEKITVMHSENVLTEIEKKFRTCSTEVDIILKDFMDKNVESNISDSTKQSDIKKINSTNLQYENNLEEICEGSHESGCKKVNTTVMQKIALSENENKMRTCSTEVDTILEITKKRNINDSTKHSDVKKINNTSPREECSLDSDPQEKEGKHHQSSYCDCESQHKENHLSSSAQEKDEKNHVSPIDRKNTQEEILSDSSVQKNEEKNYQCSFNGQSQQDEYPLRSNAKEKDEENNQSPFSGQSQKANIQNLLCSSDGEKDKTSHKKSFELINKGTYITVAKHANDFEEPVEQYKTSPNPLGKIEEKLDKVIETMNHILYEVKLRMLDIKTEKFDTATSTMSRNIAEERETCTAFSLIEEEINNNEYDNSDPNERCNKDLFKRSDRVVVKDNTTINVAHINSFPAPLNTANNASISRQDFPASILVKSNTKASSQKKLQNENLEHLVSQIKIDSLKTLDKDKKSTLDGHFIATSKYIEERLSAVDQSIIDIKKVSKSFMEDLLRSKPNLIDEYYDVPATSSKQPTTISIENIINRNLGSIKINNKAKNHQVCCVVTNLSGMHRPQYHHGSATNTAEMLMEDVCCSNDATMKKSHPHTQVPVDQAVSTEHQKPIETCDKCNSTKLLIVVDRAVSEVDENIISKKNCQHNYILVDRAVSKIDDIILEEMRKSNQAKKDINDLLNRQFTNNYGVQITFEIPTKERSTEVTDSLSTAIVSNKSSSKGKLFMTSPARRSPLTIAAVNTEPMSLQSLFQLSANSMRQLLAVICSGYSSYLPTVGRTLPVAGEAVQYLCHVCGAAFRKPSELRNHMRCYHMDSSRDCCVCRHMLQLRERSPGVFACRFCGQMFTRAYCCELHERSCLRRGGRSLDVSESRAILK